MSDYEQAQRISAWTWAAQTLGVNVTQERIAGLVGVTRRVRLDNLRPALERVIQSEPQGFLPSPGAVIAAANRIAERKLQRIGPGEMSAESHRRWMDDHNPERWTTEQHREHKRRIESEPGYKARVYARDEQRHAWAAEQVAAEIGSRPVSHAMRIQMRREYNREARFKFPAPDPLKVSA